MNQHQSPWLVFFLLSAFLTTGCTTLEGPANPDDPFESFNRSVYSFNETIDDYAIKPIAKGYKKITPGTLDKGITNIFSNLDDVIVVINDVLQFNLTQTASDFSRLFINTTIGIAGFIDIASDLDLKKHNEDFGQTLGVWGVSGGPYLVLPFIGPSSVRDGAGFFVDITQFDVITNQLEGKDEVIVLSIKYIDVRADLLKASKLLQEIAPDPYAFTRDAWTQRRKHLVNNGEPAPETDTGDNWSDDDLFKDDIIRK